MRRLINLTITALVVSAAVSSIAAAQVIDHVSPDARDSARQPSSRQIDLRSPDARLAFGPGPVSTSPVVRVSSGGFEWSDAGIGAAGMLGAISLCGALYLLSGRRRERHLPRAIG
jgi:hypothetical protein